MPGGWWARWNSCLSLPGEAEALALAIHRWLKPVTLKAEWVLFAAVEVTLGLRCLLFTRTLRTTQATGSCTGEGMPSGTGWPHHRVMSLVITAEHFPSCSEEICSLNFSNKKSISIFLGPSPVSLPFPLLWVVGPRPISHETRPTQPVNIWHLWRLLHQ